MIFNTFPRHYNPYPKNDYTFQSSMISYVVDSIFALYTYIFYKVCTVVGYHHDGLHPESLHVQNCRYNRLQARCIKASFAEKHKDSNTHSSGLISQLRITCSTSRLDVELDVGEIFQ